MTTQKYVSRLGLERNYAYAPGLYWQMDWQQIQTDWPTPQCYLVALDDKQIELILNLVTVFPAFYRNWGYTKASLDLDEWDDIQTFIAELEGCLMMGCNIEDIIDSLDGIASAIAASTGASGTGSACCAGGSRPPTTSGDEGSATPPPYFELTEDEAGSPAYQTRKCKAANLGHAQIKEVVQGIIDGGVQTLLNTTGFLGLAAATSLIGFIIGEILTPFPLIDGLAGATIGFLYGIAVSLLDGGIDLDQMMIDLETDEQEYTCALYASDGGSQAIADYLQAAADAGMSVSNRLLLAAILSVDWVNALYFDPKGYAEAFNAALDGYVGPIDPCCECFLWVFGQWEGSDVGELLVENTPIDIDVRTVDAGQAIPREDLWVRFSNYGSGIDPKDWCGPTVTLSVTLLAGTPSDGGEGENIYRMWDQAGTLIYDSNTIPSPTAGVARIAFISYPSGSPIDWNLEWVGDEP